MRSASEPATEMAPRHSRLQFTLRTLTLFTVAFAPAFALIRWVGLSAALAWIFVFGFFGVAYLALSKAVSHSGGKGYSGSDPGPHGSIP